MAQLVNILPAKLLISTAGTPSILRQVENSGHISNARCRVARLHTDWKG